MRPDPNNLVWIDMEMTGLQPDSDRIIEMALLVTDAELRTVAEGPVWVIHQPAEVLDAMDSWNKGTHTKTGLVEKVRASTLTEAQAEGLRKRLEEERQRLMRGFSHDIKTRARQPARARVDAGGGVPRDRRHRRPLP